MEKNISPFAPWDQSLPLFINDPRYILLGSMKDRREVYEEYCRDVGRARRLNKPTSSSLAGPSEKKADPEKEYKALLREEVTSTRTRFDDFKKKWKKDRRFYGYGRDDREREKAFKTHLRELGERKRADAERAEKDFADLLAETEGVGVASIWAEVKKGISGDARYDAVGSSSLREELFEGYKKKLAMKSEDENGEDEKTRKERERKEKAEASLREREAKVREEKDRVGKEMGKSRAGAGREEGERLFGSLLVDQIRDHDVSSYTSWCIG
jgi:transcription elongation regulator 1